MKHKIPIRSTVGLGSLLLAACGLTLQVNAQELFSDDFMDSTLNAAKWRVDNQPFESGTTDVLITVGGGSLNFSGTDLSGWWGGSAVMTVPTFAASPETNVIFEVDRVSEFGLGTASRSAIWITDTNRQNFVFFSDNRGEGNWGYNRRINAAGDNPTGSGANLPVFDALPYTDAGTHTIKAIANGRTVKLYLDNVFGAEVPFPLTSGIVFGLGSYARAVNDSMNSTFANPKVTAAQTVLFTTAGGTIQNSTELLVGMASTNIAVKIPAGQNASQPFTVRVKSSDPTVALPVGAVGDTLTLNFPAGGAGLLNVPVQALKNGAATLTLENDAGVLIGNSVQVLVVYTTAGTLLQDDFAGATYDTTKWALNPQGFEAGTGDLTVAVDAGRLRMSGGLAAQYWGGASLKTVSPFIATKDMPLVFEMDRVSLAYTGTAGRSGVFITTADRSRYVFLGQNWGETGWQVNVNPGNPTGGGTGIAAFNNSMNNGASHRMRLVADGEGVDIYLDGVYGGRFAFAVQSEIYFEIGTYARAQGDTVTALYDNVKIGTEFSPIVASPSAVVIAANQLNQEVAVMVSPALVRGSSAAVSVVSRDPSVAVPAGAVNGVLTLNFTAGGSPTNKFTVTPVGVGTTTFDITNALGIAVANSVAVTVTESLFTLLTDDFSGAAFDPLKWRIDPLGLESLATTTNDSYLTVTNGRAQIYTVAGGLGETANMWWGGAAFATKQVFSARPTAPVSFEIDRVAHVGTGAERRSAMLITDLNRSSWVMFSDDDLNGGWVMDTSAGTLRQVNTGIAAFSDSKYRDGGLHRMKMLADGSTVKLYLDGVLGATVPFALSNGIVFEFGAYARGYPDSILATFDNALVTGPIPNIYTTNTSVLITADQTTSGQIAITVPAQLHATTTAHVTITSSDPTVAIPQGGVGGALTLNFAPGAADTQTFQIARVGYGTATFTFSNDAGVASPAPLAVTVQNATPTSLLADSFTSASIGSQWQVNLNHRFEPQFASAADGMASVVSEQLQLSLTVTSNYWPAVLVTTTTNFQASATDPLTFEIDRNGHYGAGTGTRSGVYIMDASGSNYVLFSDLTENGLNWNFNRSIGQAGDNATGGGTAIAAFGDAIYRDSALHRIKIVANGQTARLYLDGVFGVEVPFPFSSGIKFGVMVAGRAETDTITADFDNVSITGSARIVTPDRLTAKLVSGKLVISWSQPGTLQQKDTLNGTWSDVPSAASPYQVDPTGASKFYRLRQ